MRSEQFYQRVLTRAGVPKRYQTVQPQDVSQKLLTPLDRSLFIHGPTGTGKTHFMCAYLAAIKSAHPSTICLFTSATQMVADIRAETMAAAEDKRKGLIAAESKFIDADVLFIDDFGVTKVTEWVVQVLDTIIDRRYSDLKQIVITSNKTLGQIAEIDDRIASRLAEMCTILVMDNKDWRVGDVS